MVLALEFGHESGRLEAAGVADGAVAFHDFVGDFSALTSGGGIEGTGIGDTLQHALLLHTLEDSSGLDQGVAVTEVCHGFRRSAGGGYLVTAGVEETAVRMAVLGGDLSLESAGRRCETVGEDSGGECVHEVAFLLFPFRDCVTGAFALDVVQGDDLLGGRDYRVPR